MLIGNHWFAYSSQRKRVQSFLSSYQEDDFFQLYQTNSSSTAMDNSQSLFNSFLVGSAGRKFCGKRFGGRTR